MLSTSALRDPIMHEIRRLATAADTRVLVMAGLNFRTADIRVREKLACADADLPTILQHLTDHPAVEEAFLLSTCNRTEVYLLGDRAVDWQQVLPEILAAHCQASAEELAECLYTHEDARVAHHLFRVAAGLDSMVIGECEIVRQIKRAAETARAAGAAGTILQRLVEKALAASKRTRTQVRYDECGLSVASLAVTACKRFFHDDLSARTVLVLGAGETAELTLHYLVNKGVKQVLIANRTVERAQQLARLTGGTALSLSEFPHHLAEADLLISCTASPEPLVTAAMLAPVLAAHPEKRLLVIDLAVPRDVEPDVAALPGARLLNVDTLHGTARDVARQRQDKVQDAERIIAEEAGEFAHWLASRKTVAMVKALHARIERLCATEADNLAAQLGLTPQERRQIVEPQIQALAEEILREAFRAMGEVTGADDDSEQMQLARKMLEQFGAREVRARAHDHRWAG